MKTRYFLACSVLIVAAVLVTLIFYSRVPVRVPLHWNLHGQADRFGPKWVLLTLYPGMMLAFLGLFALLPWLSPKHFEMEPFYSTYLHIMLIFMGMFAYLQLLHVWLSVAGHANMVRAILGGICVFIALVGNLLGKVRRNFYIGVRTPWTIADERVWNATHRFAAKMFTAGGLIALVLTFATHVTWLPIAVILLIALSTVLYSLLFYKSLERRGEV
jgi:uncharacterized membrane protein